MDANTEALQKLNRAFLVLVDASSFDVKKGTFSHNLLCHTVLVGHAAHVDQVRDAASVANKGPWTTNPEQIKSM
jgi:hypothetical protein